MKTNFSAAQLGQPHIAEADKILKTCQHFGFCTSGCPTYVILHDENDGPRGRIDLIKEMLESGQPPSAKTVEHIDRCLSCMSCMTTCAVNVDYMHLVDTGRAHIEAHYRRPFRERLARNALAYVLPRPALFRPALALGRLAARVEYLVPRSMRHALKLLPKNPPADTVVAVDASTGGSGNIDVGGTTPAYLYPAWGVRRWRVAMLPGCVQPVLSPHINAATIRLLNRFGCDVVIPAASACCGSLTLHMGKQAAAKGFAARNVRAWQEELDGEGLDAILVNASGCGTTVKDYGHLLGDDVDLAPAAARVAALAMDICEWLARMDIPEPAAPRRHRVAYHDACSLRNAQKVTTQPRALLRKAGFQVADIPEAHFCCGSAGTYNLLQPAMAAQLGERKAANISRTEPQIVAAGNIGCITQIGLYSGVPIVHTVELLDWAHGGPLPAALCGLELPQLEPEAAPEALGGKEAGFANGKPGGESSGGLNDSLNDKDADDGSVGIW